MPFAFARTGNWFVSKIPPLLAIAYLAILAGAAAPRHAIGLLAAGFTSIICVAIYGHVINDIFDIEADQRAGKLNQLAGMPPVRRWSLAGLFLLAGYLPCLLVPYPHGALLLLSLNYAWPSLYSLPITRLKERGVLGIACDALGAHITPTLFIMALFRSDSALTLAATLWGTALGIKGILHHQIADRENDTLSGTETFATKTNPLTLQRFLSFYHLLIELPASMLLVAIVLPVCPLAALALAAYTVTESIKYRMGFQFALSAGPATIRASLPFTNEMFYTLWLPVAASLQLGLTRPGYAWLPLLHLAIFYQPVVRQMDDWRAIRDAFFRAPPASDEAHSPGPPQNEKRADMLRLYGDSYAAAYEQKFLLDPLVRADTEAELRLLKTFLSPGVNWLDVACGTGFFLRHFPQVDRAGLDLSPAMLRLARRGNPAIALREHDFLEPIQEWENRWGLVSCMWYAYGLVERIADLDRLAENLWSWTAPLGRCFVPLADPCLITGANLPYQAPTHNTGRVMITGIIWSYIEDEIGASHLHQLAPNIEFMADLFSQYFESVEIIRYPPAFPGWQGRPALIARGKRSAPDRSCLPGPVSAH
jgi:4-hydroxybenzoate polyprenyltransferase/SAM-dependent methyltransferase